ncbi:DUF4189 domain-containing protein [Mycolicibacterium helvum]
MICRFAITTAVVASGFLVAPAAHSTPLVAASPCAPGTYVNPDDLSACIPNAPGNDYVALSASVSAGRTFWGTAPSEREADRVSIAQCVASTNSACEMIARTHNGCIAVAYSDGATPASEAGIGLTPDAASAESLARLHGGQVYDVKCSAP